MLKLQEGFKDGARAIAREAVGKMRLVRLRPVRIG